MPDKLELERQQLHLENEKLKLEAEKLKKEVTPDSRWSTFAKNFVALGGAVSMVGAVYGIWDSYAKTLKEREHTRTAEARARFEDAIKRLESSSTISKLVGVSVLSGYLDKANADLHRQVLFTIAVLMATETDRQTQGAVIDLIATFPKDGPIKAEDWEYFQDILVSQNRALLAKGDLLTDRAFQPNATTKGEETTAKTLGRLIAINVRKGLVSQRVKYDHIYCADCDFRGVVFSQGADFTGSVLDGADFRGATLRGATFDNAELLRANFSEASLKNTRFRSIDEKYAANIDPANPEKQRALFARTQYLDHIGATLSQTAVVRIRMPNFSCANLEGADFDHHALFAGVFTSRRTYTPATGTKPPWFQSVPDYVVEGAHGKKKYEFSPVIVLPAKFFNANLTGAKLRRTLSFSFDYDDEPTDFLASAHGMSAGDMILWQGNIDSDAFKLEDKDKGDGRKRSNAVESQTARDVREFQRRMRAGFYQANVDKAELPEDLEKFLKVSKPTRSDAGLFPGPFTDSDPDLSCTPRRD